MKRKRRRSDLVVRERVLLPTATWQGAPEDDSTVRFYERIYQRTLTEAERVFAERQAGNITTEQAARWIAKLERVRLLATEAMSGAWERARVEGEQARLEAYVNRALDNFGRAVARAKARLRRGRRS